MTSLSILCVVGTRPEIIRLSRILAVLNQHTNLYLIHTGQNYDYTLNKVFFEDLGLSQPYAYLDCASRSSSPSESIANMFISLEPYITRIRPDAFLCLGDTNSCLSAYVAKRHKIPIFHLEAGNRCFDQRVPEEINRKLVDHLSDINLTYSTISRQYLIQEGFPPDRIIKVGSPLSEVINYYYPNIIKSDILKRLSCESGKFFLVSFHRDENVSDPHNLQKFIHILNSLSLRYSQPILVSLHPRTKHKLEPFTSSLEPNIRLLSPLGFFDYVNLQVNSRCVLSDSGSISEESSILHFNAINLRSAHERPESNEEAVVPMSGLSVDRIIQLIDLFDVLPTSDFDHVRDYQHLNVSKKVLRIILSYTDVVNSIVWKKS